ncbi:hypothetical protein RFI_09245 [Reticulomyxa filosa]|uniref:Uncharacterized protein n=1 Tax=Reticulomyxa filosa TaxID=46433 RepID=X6NPH9_RETFI|nr:hypothetical protein RFI_09245 [Reticulomyxa filosa]|eukprot:ETO27891.1 hypothetical protein RFI_09245 [Reticulomyxa filosa]
MISKVFVTIDSTKYEIGLTTLSIQSLKDRIIEISKSDQHGNTLLKITDSNGHVVETDQNVMEAFEYYHGHFAAHFEPSPFFLYISVHFFFLVIERNKSLSKNEEEKRKKSETSQNELIELKNPLVLLAGAMEYENQPNVDKIKTDLVLLKALFQQTFGYEVFTTFDPEKKTTGLLTLDELNGFVLSHGVSWRESARKESYDGLIFVWCGHRGFEDDRDTLVTSEGKTKTLKSIIDAFAIDTSCFFVRKPKIFITIGYEKEGSSYFWTAKVEASKFRIKLYGTVLMVISSHCLHIHSENMILALLTWKTQKKEVLEAAVIGQAPESDVMPYTSTETTLEVYWTQRSSLSAALVQSDDVKQEPEALINSQDGYSNMHIPSNIHKHRNKYWKLANMEATKMVEEMMRHEEQGLIIVANNIPQLMKPIDESLPKDQLPFSMLVNSSDMYKKEFDTYWVCCIKKEWVILDYINIDGNVYVVDCHIQGIGTIDMQVFVTDHGKVDPCLELINPSILWNTKFHHDIPIQIQGLIDKGQQCTDIILFDDSISYFQQALQICIGILGNAHPDVSDLYSYLGDNYDNKGDYDKAIECYEEALKIRLNCLGTEHPDVATSYCNLGATCYNKQDYKKAAEHHCNALDIRLNIFGNNHIDVATSYQHLGNSCFKNGQYDKAIKNYQKAVTIRLNLTGKNNYEVAKLYDDLGSMHVCIGSYLRAIQDYEEALNIRLSIFGMKHVDVAKSYEYLGDSYVHMGEYEKSTECHEKALKIRLDLFGNIHGEVADSYYNLGYNYDIHKKSTKDNGKNCDKAIEYYEKALQIRLELFGNKTKDVSLLYHCLGYTFSEKGDHEKGIQYFEKSLTIKLEILGPNNGDVACLYGNLGTNCCEKGDYDKAVAYNEKSLQIRLEIYGNQHINVGWSYFNLGYSCFMKGLYERATEYFGEVITIGSFNAATTDNLITNIKYFNDSDEQFQKAAILYEEALNIGFNCFGFSQVDVGRLYERLGNTCFDKKLYEKAMEYHEKALKVRSEFFGNFHEYVADSNWNLGIVFETRGGNDLARAYYEKAFNMYQTELGNSHTKTVATKERLISLSGEKCISTFAIYMIFKQALCFHLNKYIFSIQAIQLF